MDPIFINVMFPITLSVHYKQEMLLECESKGATNEKQISRERQSRQVSSKDR